MTDAEWFGKLILKIFGSWLMLVYGLFYAFLVTVCYCIWVCIFSSDHHYPMKPYLAYFTAFKKLWQW